MKNRILLILLYMVLPVAALAQPTINGSASDTCYGSAKTTFTGSNGTTWGDWGIKAIYACAENQTLYITLNGAIKNGNYEDMLVFINVSNQQGLAANGEIPGGNDGLSPFNKYKFPSLNPIQTDFGLRLTLNPSLTEGYVSLISYMNGGNTDTYQGTVSSTGTEKVYNTMKFAYLHSTSMSGSGTNGFEMAIPYSVLGASSTANFQLYAVYGNENGNVYSVAPGTLTTSWILSTPTTIQSEVPEGFSLSVYPNPFNPQATARFSVTETQHVRIELFNTLGQRVQEVYKGLAQAGQPMDVLLNGQNLPSGPYYLRMTSANYQKTQPVSLIK